MQYPILLHVYKYVFDKYVYKRIFKVVVIASAYPVNRLDDIMLCVLRPS